MSSGDIGSARLVPELIRVRIVPWFGYWILFFHTGLLWSWS